MRPLCVPVLAIVWLLTLFYVGGQMYTFVSIYQDELCHANRTVQADIAYYKDICTDPAKKNMYDVWRACEEKEHAFHKPIYRYAMAATVKKFGLCGSVDCEQLLLRNAYLMNMVWVGLAIIILTSAVATCICFRHIETQKRSPYLPETAVAKKVE